MSGHEGDRAGRSLAGGTVAWLWLCWAWTAAAPLAAQPKVLGPQDCEKCHKQQLKKWRTDEPAQLGPKAHAATHKQLVGPQAARYAAALGLADPADPRGRCVTCHATVVRGSVRTGVSCESCHGAASLWNPVHDKEPLAESYRESLGLGLRDLHGKPAEIARLCVSCHVTPERVLAQAGHPDGAGFDAGAGLRKLVHWTAAFTGDGGEHAAYDYAQVSAAARPWVQKALALARGGAAVKPGVAAAGAATPAVGARTGAGGGLAAGSPAPAPSKPAGAASASRTAESVPAPPAPWDWDQPVPPLPDDYPSEPESTAGAEARAAAPEAPAAAATASPAAPGPPVRAARRPLSIAVDQPAVEAPDAPAATEPSRSTGVRASTAPRSAAAVAAELGTEAAALLERLLASGRRAPQLPPPVKPREFSGPDSELLAIEDAALFLALEALRRPPVAAAPAPEAPAGSGGRPEP